MNHQSLFRRVPLAEVMKRPARAQRILLEFTVPKEDVGGKMIDRTNAGKRCQTLQLIRTVKGDLKRGAQGTVVNSQENIGRVLVIVDWDEGFTVPVFPDEIDIEL
jgi:hypothetical protein